MKSMIVLDVFQSFGCTKSLKFERIMIVQTYTHDKANREFFFLMGVGLNNHIFLKFEAFQTFHFFRICFSMSVFYQYVFAILSQKKYFFLPKTRQKW